jgi:hypothetical protein
MSAEANERVRSEFAHAWMARRDYTGVCDNNVGSCITVRVLVSMLPRYSGEDITSSEPLKENCNCFCQ